MVREVFEALVGKDDAAGIAPMFYPEAIRSFLFRAAKGEFDSRIPEAKHDEVRAARAQALLATRPVSGPGTVTEAWYGIVGKPWEPDHLIVANADATLCGRPRSEMTMTARGMFTVAQAAESKGNEAGMCAKCILAAALGGGDV
jgi:hypothetical protein